MSAFRFVLLVSNALVSLATDSLDIRELCPHNKFCADGPLSLFNESGLRPCCSPCSCSDDCHELGNCCPDKPYSDVISPQTIPCRTQEEIYKQFLNRNVDSKLFVKFKVIDSCPVRSFHVTELKTAANRCRRIDQLENLAFVSDANDKVYLNRFCAQCNGVTRFKRWDLLIPCENIFQERFETLEETTAYIFHRCDVISKPPRGFNIITSVCPSMNLKECNFTGNWDFYDYEIKRKCETYDVPYMLSLLESYANVYCYICNKPKGTPIYPRCNLFDVPWFERTTSYPFTAIMDFRKETEPGRPPSQVKSTNCSKVEVFDVYTNRCMKLLCPAGTVHSNGVCQEFVDFTNGYCICSRLCNMVISHDEEILITAAESFANGVKLIMNKILSSLGIDCGFSRVSVLERPTGEVCAELCMFSTVTCSHLKLLKAFATFAKVTNVSIYEDGEKMSFPVFHLEGTYSKREIYWSENNHICHPVFVTNRTVYCPSIEYDPLDVLLSFSDSNVAKQILHLSDRVDERKLTICLDDYRTVMETVSISGACAASGSYAFGIFIFSYLFNPFSLKLRAVP